MTKSLLVGIQPSDRSVALERGLLVISGNMFVFLIAGHEVRSSRSSCGVVPRQFRLYRPQRIHYASHLPYWLCILMNKNVCINTSKVLCPA